MHSEVLNKEELGASSQITRKTKRGERIHVGKVG